MVFLVQLLIISLPFVAYPRILESIKLSDIVLLMLIAASVANHKLRPTRYSLLLALFFVAFSIYGFFYINYFDQVSVLGTWDEGLVSTSAYQGVAAIQTLIFIFGFAVAARYLVAPETGLMRFQLRYFLIWSGVILLLYALPPTRDLVTYNTFGVVWPRGTLTEKGGMAEYVAFTYVMVMTYQIMPGARRFARWEVIAFVVMTVLDLVLCRADRGTIYFIIFSVIYLITQRPALAVRLAPAALVIGSVMIPALIASSDKIQYYLAIIFGETGVTMVGRYAAVYLFPKLIAHSPILGVGYGNYIFYRTSSQYASLLPIVPKDEPDCILIQILVECGVIGSILFFGMVLAYPLRRLIALRLKFLWPFAITYAVSLLESVTTYYQFWLLLFFMLEAARFASQAQEAPAREPAQAMPVAPAWAAARRITQRKTV